MLKRPDVAARRGDTTDPFTLPPSSFYDAAKGTARVAVLPDYLRVAAVENERALKRAWKALIDAGLPPDQVAELVRPLVSEDEMIRLGREVWSPLRVPAGATPEQAADVQRREEMRLREKAELLREWRETLRQRYETLAARAAVRT